MRVGFRIMAVLLLGCSCYLIWAWQRWDLWNIAHDSSWPHSFPYPDNWLMALEHYLDQANPAREGAFKMQGEYQQVKVLLGSLVGLFVVASVVFGLPTVFQLTRRVSMKQRGFPMDTTSSGYKSELN